MFHLKNRDDDFCTHAQGTHTPHLLVRAAPGPGMRLRAPGLLAFLLTPPCQITPLPSPTPALQLAVGCSHRPPAAGLSLTRLQSIDPEGARSAQRLQSRERTAQCALALEGEKKWEAEARLIYRDVPTPGGPEPRQATPGARGPGERKAPGAETRAPRCRFPARCSPGLGGRGRCGPGSPGLPGEPEFFR